MTMLDPNLVLRCFAIKSLRAMFQYISASMAILMSAACVAGTWSDGLPRFSPGAPWFSATDIQRAGAWISMDHRKIPKNIMRALPKDVLEDFRLPDTPEDASLEFALLDLNGDKKDEILVIHPWARGSGGRNFIILQEKQLGKWKVIGEIPGGPIFQPHEEKWRPYYQIVSYSRFGADVRQYVFDYTGGKYQLVLEFDAHRTLTDSEWWYAYWQQLNLYGCPDEGYVCRQGIKSCEQQHLAEDHDAAPFPKGCNWVKKYSTGKGK